MDINSIMTNGVIVVPIIIGMVQLFKNLVPSRFWKWCPLISIGLGMLITWLTKDYSLKNILLSGIVLGLVSSGLYSGVKTVATDSRKDEL